MATPRCRSCGRFFKPYPQQGKRQKCCGGASCRRILQQRKQQDWCKRHPGYGKTRHLKIRGWAKAYPDYWQRYRKTHPAYREHEKTRMGRRRGHARRVAKQTAWRRIAVEKLRAVRRIGPKTVAKQTASARRTEAIVDFLLWKESVAKQRPMEAAGGPGG